MALVELALHVDLSIPAAAAAAGAAASPSPSAADSLQHHHTPTLATSTHVSTARVELALQAALSIPAAAAAAAAAAANMMTYHHTRPHVDGTYQRARVQLPKPHSNKKPPHSSKLEKQ
jgi:hypothetical protein